MPVLSNLQFIMLKFLLTYYCYCKIISKIPLIFTLKHECQGTQRGQHTYTFMKPISTTNPCSLQHFIQTFFHPYIKLEARFCISACNVARPVPTDQYEKL
jgi:hypothetical protein